MHPKQACVDCQFFVRVLPPGTLTDREVAREIVNHQRMAMRRNDFASILGIEGLECRHLVWADGFGLEKSKRYDVIVETERKGNCFFFRYQPGMLFPAAEKLQKRAAEFEEAERTRKLARRSYWIAGIGFALTVLWNVLKEFVFPLLRQIPKPP